MLNEDDKDDLTNIFLATRNIGLHRNRGLGYVQCELKKQIKDSEDGKESLFDKIKTNLISITLENDQPIILSNENNQTSVNYIPGRALIGALAADCWGTMEPKLFDKLFVTGETIFTALYPSIDGKRFVPAPYFIAKLKKSEKKVNILSNDRSGIDTEKAAYDPANGNQPKMLNEKFLSLQPEQSEVTEIDERVIYHHSRRDSANGVRLFTQSAMKEHQQFTGYIKCPDEQCRTALIQILQKRVLRIGKSKTAQYGRCRIVDAKGVLEDCEQLKAAKDEVLLVSCASDTLFTDENGYTVQFSKIYKEIAKQTGIAEYIKDIPAGNEDLYSILKTTKVSGYNAQWNLRLPMINAVKAGSTFVYILKNDISLSLKKPLFVGERNNEGFGEVKIFRMKEYPYKMDIRDASNDHGNAVQGNKGKEIEKRILLKSLGEKTAVRILANQESLAMSASTLGRITLMLKEAQSTDNVFNEYYQRLISIKSFKEKREALSLLDSFSNDINKETPALTVDKLMKLTAGEPERKHLDDETVRIWLRNSWHEILMKILVMQKYNKKGELKNEDN